MTRENVTLAVFIIGGLLLLSNPIWLFPNASEYQYTYKRVPIGVENGTLTYDLTRCESSYCKELDSRKNDLNLVDCQPRDTDYGDTIERACLFEEYLVDRGPLHLPKRDDHAQRDDIAEPPFVQLDDTYYRRIYRANNNSTVTIDVERVPPKDVLAAVAENFTGFEADAFSHWENRLAVTGGATTISREPDDQHLGNVYYRNGTYYTIIVIDSEIVSQPLGDITRMDRLGMMAFGGLLQVGVAAMFLYDEWAE